jgi:predicted RNA-binding Zn-ribbon protein involved in translation (DUF1610 family)
MSFFKKKPIKETKKKQKQDVHISLMNKHKEKVNNFEIDKQSINDIICDINRHKTEIEDLNKLTDYNIQTTTIKSELISKIEHLEKRKQTIESDQDVLDYYSSVGDVIIDYYKVDNKTEPLEKKNKSILDFLVCDTKDTDKCINTNELTKREELLDRYLTITEGTTLEKHSVSDRIKMCEDCNVEKKIQVVNGLFTCPECGNSDIIIIDEENQTKDYSAYKRINHFIEWLNQIQGKESTEIPSKVYDDIIKEIKLRNIKDLAKLNMKIMRQILHKLRLSKYYEHTIYIINKLNNLPTPNFTRVIENDLKLRFVLIQKPWLTYKSPKRKNFLSYSYVLYKFCEMLHMDEYLVYFTLLKSDMKLREQDELWEKICKSLDWTFYSTFE